MAKYKAIVSFSGLKISMRNGEVRELSDQPLIDNLLKAGQIIELKETPPKATQEPKEEPQAEPEPKEAKPKSSRKGKKS